ncbi:MAG: membrane protein insertion efficiency factor YidD [Bacteroidales bacterium]|nr:membrane protein insertion efficiency factor YidD [Bacteroidales bacterium]
MKWLFLLFIKLYWKVVPESRRPNCLFKETCSHFVYKETVDKGFHSGLIALLQRIKKCRNGYTLYTSEQGLEMRLADGSVIGEDEISPYILDSV